MRVIQPKDWLLVTATTTNFFASRLSVYPFITDLRAEDLSNQLCWVVYVTSMERREERGA